MGKIKTRPIELHKQGKPIPYINALDAGDMYDRYIELENVVDLFAESELNEDAARAALKAMGGGCWTA